MLFQNWSDIGRVLLVGTLAYVLLVVVLRISGKRTLSKMNAFDLVVTVALGSTLATILLTSTVSLAEGGVGLVLLIVLQYLVARLDVRSRRFRTIIKAEPLLLLSNGEPDRHAMREARVTEGELRQAVRLSGQGSLEDVAAVVLETDGSLSVVPVGSLGDSGSALADVAAWKAPGGGGGTEGTRR